MRALWDKILGLTRRARWRVGSFFVSLGVRLHVAVADLGFALAPELAGDPEQRRSAWPGLLIVVVLVWGLACAGIGGMWMVREALPHREVTP